MTIFRELSPGTIIPAFWPWLPPAVVLEQKFLDDGRVYIRTTGPENHNEWTADSGTELNMPMDSIRKPIMWWKEQDSPPRLHEIRVGDGLQYRNAAHTVKKLGRRGTTDIYTVSLYTINIAEGTQHRFRIHRDELVVLDKLNEDMILATNVRDRVNTPPYGPYVYGNTRYFFRIHPYGRGRWPAYIKEFVLNENLGDYECRPPSPKTGRQYWDQFDFTGDVRHPGDPT